MSKVKEKQAKRRSEIIESLIPLMTSEDFDKISVSDLCQTAGISIGTFYHYFTKKSDMLIGLLWIIDEDLKENTFPLLTNEDEMENLRMFARGWASYIQSHGLERSKLISGVNPEGWGNLEKERISSPYIQKRRRRVRNRSQRFCSGPRRLSLEYISCTSGYRCSQKLRHPKSPFRHR